MNALASTETGLGEKTSPNGHTDLTLFNEGLRTAERTSVQTATQTLGGNNYEV